MDRYSNRERYFMELEATAREFYLPYLRELRGKGHAGFAGAGNDTKVAAKGFGPGFRILEVGCGEGGNLAPFSELGCEVLGVDLAEGKIENARRFFAERGLAGEFRCEDILETGSDGVPFDLVLIHDVVEHIEPEDKKDFFRKIQQFCSSNTIVFFGFPAWMMPFGGHQQSCAHKVCKLPFIHLLPLSLYRWILVHGGESQAKIDDLLSIRRSKMTVESFERLASEAGYSIEDRVLWFINPHYKSKFGLRPRRLCKPFCDIPWLRNFLATSCHYVLRVK